jgi:hypothetical protein
MNEILGKGEIKMTRKIKVLGLAIVAVAAMSMAAASTQAFEMHTVNAGHVTLTGEQTTQFVAQTAAGTVVCTTANFEGTTPYVSGTQITGQESTLTPTLAGCQAFGLAAQIKMNGCKFTITNKSAAGVTTSKTGYVDIVGCTVGKQIEIIGGGGACTETIPQQNNLSHVVFENKGSGSQADVEINLTLSGITYEIHGGFCPGSPTQTVLTHDGKTEGKATFKSHKYAGSEQVTLHSHQYNKLLAGEQVGMLAT